MPVSAPPTLHFQWDSGQRVWEARRRESGTYQGVQASGIVVGDSTVTAYFEGQTSWLLSDLQDPWVCSFLLASLTPWPMLPSRKLGLVLVEVFMPFLWVRDPWWRVVKIWWNSWLCMKHSSDWVFFFFCVFTVSKRLMKQRGTNSWANSRRRRMKWGRCSSWEWKKRKRNWKKLRKMWVCSNSKDVVWGFELGFFQGSPENTGTLIPISNLKSTLPVIKSFQGADVDSALPWAYGVIPSHHWSHICLKERQRKPQVGLSSWLAVFSCFAQAKRESGRYRTMRSRTRRLEM